MLLAALTILIASVIGWSTLHAGMPALRHDWLLPENGPALSHTLLALTHGWNADGIGSLQPYPTFYLVAGLLWPFHLFGGIIAVFVVIVASTALAAYGAARMARPRNDLAAAAALILVATANPWVYTELVAGHVFMVFAYAVLVALTGEAVAERPRLPLVVLLGALLITQIEFLVVAIVPFAAWCIRRRAWLPPAVLFWALLPIVVGLAASYASVRATPYNLDWQIAASVRLEAGLLFSGYFTGYARGFDALGPFGILLAVAALFGLTRLRGRSEVTIVTVGIAAVVVASGTRGPIAPLYDLAVLHVPESGLFRELYDLIGVYAVAFVLALARSLGAHRALGIAAAACSLTLLVPWLRAPAAAWFVPEASIPRPAFTSAAQRIAFVPAYQPMTFEGAGSGLDPDVHRLLPATDAVNEAFPTFPVEAALGRAIARGDTEDLAGLGAGALVARPYLTSDAGALAGQGVGTDVARAAAVDRAIVHPVPLFSVSRTIAVVTIGNRPSEDAIFYGDRFPSAPLVRFSAQRSTIRADLGWIDARVGFIDHPGWANAFGGVITSSGLPLRVPADRALLAAADGTLRSMDGRVLLARSAELHWVRPPAGTTAVRCMGTCIVALAGEPPALPEHAFHAPRTALNATRRFDGLYALTGVPDGVLRFNETYDRWWIAVADGHIVPHERLDTALNAWTLPRPARAVYVIHLIACLQAALEVVAWLVLAAALVYAIGASAASDALGA